MKAKYLISLFALLLLGSGCALSNNLIRTTIVQPHEFCNILDEKWQKHRFRNLARRELACARASTCVASNNFSCEPFSADAERGFEDGFVDYLLYGGVGHPPPLPPRRYWRIRNQNADGYQAVQDWFQGFEQGVAVAQASGYREFVVVPMSDSIVKDTLPVYPGQSLYDFTEFQQPIGVQPIGDQPIGDQPIGDQPNGDQPIGDQPIGDQPIGDQPIGDQPVGDPPVGDQGADAQPPVFERQLDSSASSSSTDAAIAANDLPGFVPSNSKFGTAPLFNHQQVDSEFSGARGQNRDLETDSSGLKRKDGLDRISQQVASTAGKHGSNGIQQASASEAVRPPDREQQPKLAATFVSDLVVQRYSSNENADSNEFVAAGNIRPSKTAEPACGSSNNPTAHRLPPLTAIRELPNAEHVPFAATQGERIERLGPSSETVLHDHRPVLEDPAVPALMARITPTPNSFANSSAAMRTSSTGASDIGARPFSFIDAESNEVLEPSSTAHRASETKTMDFKTSLATQIHPIWTNITGTLMFVVGVIFLFRRRPRQSNHGRYRQSTSSPSTMHSEQSVDRSLPPRDQLSSRSKVAMLVALISCLMTGCASLTNPVLNGIPVRKLPPELLSYPRREGLQTIPLSLLRQPQPKDYVLGAGDVIGVFVPGVFPLTLADQPLPTPPVYFPSQIDPLGAGLPPSLGYPVTIRNDGTLAMPLVEPILLQGLTIEEANEKIRRAYEDKGILQPGREAVLVTLMQPRQIRVLVFRQEVGGFTAGGRGDITSNNVKQGTGHIVDLRAYENDVLTALAKTGGLPGLDAFDGVYIFRGGQSNAALTETLASLESPDDLSPLLDTGIKTDYIPTRRRPGEPLPFTKDDILLYEGDVVMLENRIQDLFYTGGLLPAGERILPRDYDLDVVEAVSRVTGTLINGAFGGNNFTGRLIQQGIGNPNPSALTVIRKTPGGGLVPIQVDLNRALTDPRERILVQPDDVLILQETADEAVARYVNDIFNFNIFLFFYRGSTGTGSAGLTQIPATR